jgi:outer membrane protein assembly factor BamB
VVLGDGLVLAATGASVHAFDLSTGSPVWETPVEGGTIGGLHLVGDHALVVQPDTGLRAVDLDDGETAWLRRGAVQSATVAGEVVLVADGHHVEAVGVGEGRRLWRRELPGFVASGTPGEVVAVVGDDRMTGLDVADGRTRWTLRLQPRGGADQSADRLVVSTRLGLRVIDVMTGRTLGTAHEEQDLGGRVRGQARVVEDDRIVAAVGDGMVALDEEATALWWAETGNSAWLVGEPGVVATVESGARVVLLDPETGAGVLRTTPSGWFTALAVGEQQLALAVHTPRRGRLQVHDLHEPD